MKITRTDDQTILMVDDANHKAIFTLDANFNGEADIVISSNKDSYMSLPGEYEYSDISVINVEAATNLKGKANIFKFEIQEVSVCFVTPEAEVSNVDKKMLDIIGDVDVLFVQNGISKTDVKKLNNDFAPRYILGIDISSLDEMTELTNIKASFTEKKLSLNKADLVGDEYITVTGILEK